MLIQLIAITAGILLGLLAGLTVGHATFADVLETLRGHRTWLASTLATVVILAVLLTRAYQLDDEHFVELMSTQTFALLLLAFGATLATSKAGTALQLIVRAWGLPTEAEKELAPKDRPGGKDGDDKRGNGARGDRQR